MYALDDVGSGSHVHLSLWENGKNIFMASGGHSKHGMSKVGEEFMVGVLNHLPSILAFKAPLPNSQETAEVVTKVYVGGIPYYSTEDDIRSYFESCGSITEVDCMKFPESGKFRGIAIINFKDIEKAHQRKKVEELNLDEHKLNPWEARVVVFQSSKLNVVVFQSSKLNVLKKKDHLKGEKGLHHNNYVTEMKTNHRCWNGLKLIEIICTNFALFQMLMQQQSYILFFIIMFMIKDPRTNL